MRLLLDTHVLLWFQAGDRRLSRTAWRAIDRLLAAQAITEGCPIVTRDRVFRKYGAEVAW